MYLANSVLSNSSSSTSCKLELLIVLVWALSTLLPFSSFRPSRFLTLMTIAPSPSKSPPLLLSAFPWVACDELAPALGVLLKRKTFRLNFSAIVPSFDVGGTIGVGLAIRSCDADISGGPTVNLRRFDGDFIVRSMPSMLLFMLQSSVFVVITPSALLIVVNNVDWLLTDMKRCRYISLSLSFLRLLASSFSERIFGALAPSTISTNAESMMPLRMAPIFKCLCWSLLYGLVRWLLAAVNLNEPMPLQRDNAE